MAADDDDDDDPDAFDGNGAFDDSSEDDEYEAMEERNRAKVCGLMICVPLMYLLL